MPRSLELDECFLAEGTKSSLPLLKEMLLKKLGATEFTMFCCSVVVWYLVVKAITSDKSKTIFSSSEFQTTSRFVHQLSNCCNIWYSK